MQKTPFFWTDAGQAEERLRGSFILFDNQAVLVEAIRGNRGETPLATISIYPEGKRENISLADPRFNRFRIPLPQGWVNNLYHKRAFFVSRMPNRSRTHGMLRGNVRVATISKEGVMSGGGDYSFETIVVDPQYKAAINGEYPPLALLLDKIRSGTCVAFSKDLCLFRDNDGIRWLFLGEDRVGLFSGTDTLLLLSAFSYVREQLIEAREFTVNNITEF